MEVRLEVRDTGRHRELVAVKVIQRRPGFFAFPKMMWRFTWPGESLATWVKGVVHDEKTDTFEVVFDYNGSMERAVTGQTDWEIVRDGEARAKMLERQRSEA